MDELIHRGTGLLLIEAVNSNPNGDPDRDSDPRTREDARGEISPVSFKRKLRDLVADKSTSFWKELAAELKLTDAEYEVLEQSSTKREEVKKLTAAALLQRYWDVRLFGTTFLEKDEEDKNTFITTGVAQFGLGVSLDPILIERLTTTKVFAVQEDKSKGMAPLSYRIVPYGLYAMPFFINGTAAEKTRCSRLDVELLLKVIPYAYSQTASYIRSQVNIRHAFYIEHNRARGTFNDFLMLEALTPKRLAGQCGPASAWSDYDAAALEANIGRLNQQLAGKAAPVRDLMNMA